VILSWTSTGGGVVGGEERVVDVDVDVVVVDVVVVISGTVAELSSEPLFCTLMVV
jgi:hypothetical protein